MKTGSHAERPAAISHQETKRHEPEGVEARVSVHRLLERRIQSEAVFHAVASLSQSQFPMRCDVSGGHYYSPIYRAHSLKQNNHQPLQQARDPSRTLKQRPFFGGPDSPHVLS